MSAHPDELVDQRLVRGGDRYTRGRRELVAPDGLTCFELREPIAVHHHHLVCSRCGGVLDYHPPTQLERAVDAALVNIADATGFTAMGHSVDLEGLCAACHGAASM